MPLAFGVLLGGLVLECITSLLLVQARCCRQASPFSMCIMKVSCRGRLHDGQVKIIWHYWAQQALQLAFSIQAVLSVRVYDLVHRTQISQ